MQDLTPGLRRMEARSAASGRSADRRCHAVLAHAGRLVDLIGRLALGQEPAEDVLEDPAVAEVLALLRCLQPHARSELHVVCAHRHL
jgi:hypothetical protein